MNKPMLIISFLTAGLTLSLPLACSRSNNSALPLAPNPTPTAHINGGVVTTIAGQGTGTDTNGPATQSTFHGPAGIVVDASGNIYVADTFNELIRKISVSGGVTTVSNFVGTLGTTGDSNVTGSSTFDGPGGLGIDSSGNIYEADQAGDMIREITLAGVVSNFAGIYQTSGHTNSTALASTFHTPQGTAIDASGNVYVLDYNNYLIRKISSGTVSTFVGTGSNGYNNATGTSASFSHSYGIAVDASGNVYLADEVNNAIRKITPGGVMSTFAGSLTGAIGSANGIGTAASFHSPTGITVDAWGTIYVADTGNELIRKITPAGVVSTLAGSGTNAEVDGTGTGASFSAPWAMTTDKAGNIFMTDLSTSLIREIQ